MAIRVLVASVLLAATAPLAAAGVTTGQLARHIDVLASDAFEGRAPGTPGEAKTTAYIVAQWQALGLVPAGDEGGWMQRVALVNRTPLTQSVTWTRKRRTLDQDQSGIVLLGDRAEEKIAGAPVWFVGHGAALGDADLRGAVVLMIPETPEGLPDAETRIAGLARRGASAVIALSAPGTSWRAIQARYNRGHDVLDRDSLPAIQGVMSQSAAAALIRLGGADPEALRRAASLPDFAPRRLRVTADLAASTQVRRFASNNVIGRLRGTGATGESLLYLGHWDHLGICRAEGEIDRICNGAVDNASGIAALIEIARGLASAPRRPRDILFLATTAEEIGLLGAESFAARPPVPLASIVAAINLDTVAIAPPGERVAVMGRGRPALDRLVDETIGEAKRVLDTDDEADALVQRQDGWALARFGVPTLMVGGSFSDMAALGAFLGGNYHQPGDNPGPDLPLGGAAEDADLLIRLGLKLADPTLYRHRPTYGPATDPLL